jgi:hypothetical protein
MWKQTGGAWSRIGMRQVGIVLTLAAICASASLAQRPDFTGIWKQGGPTGPIRVETIEHRDPYLKVVSESREVPTPGSTLARPIAGLMGEAEYRTDGAEHTSATPNGRQRWTSVGWADDTLVFLSIVKDGYRVSISRTVWALSGAANTLTETTRVIDMDGVRETVRTLARQ